MKLRLEEAVFSPQDLRQVMHEIKMYEKWLGAQEIRTRVTQNASKEPPALSEPTQHLIEQLSEADHLNQRAIEQLLTALEAYEKQAPRMVITLAAMPGKRLKMALVEWCRSNIAPNILVEFRFNATLLGGMVVSFGSHIYDMSFRRKILASRSRFPEVLRRV